MKIDKLLNILTRLERIKISAAFFNCQRGKRYGFTVMNQGRILAKCLAPVEQGQEILLVKEGSQWYFFPTALTRNARYKKVVSYRKIYHRSQSETILPFKIIYQVGDKVYVGGHIKKPVLVNTLDVPLYSGSDAFVTNLGKKNFTTFTRFDRYANDLYKSQRKELRVYQAQTYPYFWGGSSLVLNEPFINYTSESQGGSGFCPASYTVTYFPDDEITFGSGSGTYSATVDDPSSPYCSVESSNFDASGAFQTNINLIDKNADIYQTQATENFTQNDSTGANPGTIADSDRVSASTNTQAFDFTYRGVNFLRQNLTDNLDTIDYTQQGPHRHSFAEDVAESSTIDTKFLIFNGLDFIIYYEHVREHSRTIDINGVADSYPEGPLPTTNVISTLNGELYTELVARIYDDFYYENVPIHGILVGGDDGSGASGIPTGFTTYEVNLVNREQYTVKYKLGETTTTLDNSPAFHWEKELDFINNNELIINPGYLTLDGLYLIDAKSFHNVNHSYEGKSFKYYFSNEQGHYEVTGVISEEQRQYYLLTLPDYIHVENDSLYTDISLRLTLQKTSIRQIPYFHRNNFLIANPDSFNGFCLYLNYYLDSNQSFLMKGSELGIAITSSPPTIKVTDYREVVDRRNNISSKGNSIYLSHVDYSLITENDGFGYVYKFDLVEDKVVLDSIIQAKIFSLGVDESLGVNYFFTSYHD